MIKNIFLFFLLFFFWSCNESKITSLDDKKNVHFINKGNYLWINQPNSFYYKGKYERTYFTFVKPNGKIIIQYFDHNTKKMGKEVMLFKFNKGDDHSNPSINIVRKGIDKGKIIITFSRHSSDLYFTKTNVAENINSFYTPTVILKGNTTYPTLVRKVNHLIIFFRGKNTKLSKKSLSSTNFIESFDLGRTWSNEKIFIEANDDEIIYPGAIYHNESEIAIAWSVFNIKEKKKNNIYLSYSNDFGKKWKLNDGTFSNLISRKNSIKLLERKDIRVFDITKHKNEYLISATEFNEEGKCCNSINESFIITSKTKNIINFKTAGDYYSSGAFFNKNQKNFFYYSMKNKLNGNNIIRCEILNKNLDIKKVTLINGKKKNIIRPIPICKQKEENLLFIKVNNYTHYREFNTELYYYH